MVAMRTEPVADASPMANVCRNESRPGYRLRESAARPWLGIGFNVRKPPPPSARKTQHPCHGSHERKTRRRDENGTVAPHETPKLLKNGMCLSRVPVRFAIADAAASYHVPLMVIPRPVAFIMMCARGGIKAFESGGARRFGGWLSSAIGAHFLRGCRSNE